MDTNTIKVLDKEFKPYIPQEEIESVIRNIANQINEDYKDKNPLFLVMLNGAFMFASQLFKELTIDCETSFVKYSSYDGTQSTCEVKELIGLNSSLEGRDIVIVEDIIESGYTMKEMLHILGEKKPKEVYITSLFVKPGCLKVDLKIDYRCFDIEDDFIVGYGLDYNHEGRNLPHIYQVIE